MTNEERDELLKKIQENNIAAANESKERRQQMAALDGAALHPDQRVGDLEKEAIEKDRAIVEKALREIKERDEEVRRLKDIITNVKCHVIRDAQIKEKQAKR